MKPVLFALALLLPACQMRAPQTTPLSSSAPEVPPITADCTGPSPENFNGARLTQSVIAQIPQQFDTDRQILRAVLAGRGTPDMIRFAQLCHGLSGVA